MKPKPKPSHEKAAKEVKENFLPSKNNFEESDSEDETKLLNELIFRTIVFRNEIFFVLEDDDDDDVGDDGRGFGRLRRKLVMLQFLRKFSVSLIAATVERMFQ